MLCLNSAQYYESFGKALPNHSENTQGNPVPRGKTTFFQLWLSPLFLTPLFVFNPTFKTQKISLLKLISKKGFSPPYPPIVFSQPSELSTLEKLIQNLLETGKQHVSMDRKTALFEIVVRWMLSKCQDNTNNGLHFVLDVLILFEMFQY